MEIPESLKVPAIRESSKRLHILVMTDGGSTRRFSVSTSFLWAMASLALLVILALGVLSYLASSLLVDNGRLQSRYDFELRRIETQAYNRSLPASRDSAGRILERLDMAALSAGDDNGALPDALPEASPAGPAAAGPADPSPADLPVGGGPGAEASAGAGPSDGSGAEGGTGPPAPPEPAAEGAASAEGAVSGPDPPAAGEGEAADAGSASASPEAQAWAALHNRLTEPPAENILDVNEFRFSADGSYSYYLVKLPREGADPTERLRGRAIAVFAISDKSGKVTLAADPEIDLKNPSQGWDLGGRYNIVASKVYKGRIRIPQGGTVLSAEVLAWDEETKGLVFLKKVPLDGGA